MTKTTSKPRKSSARKASKSKLTMGAEYAVARRRGAVHGGGTGLSMPAATLPPAKMTLIDIKPNGRYVFSYEAYRWIQPSGRAYLSTEHHWIRDTGKTAQRHDKLVEVGKSEVIGLWSDFEAGMYERRGRGWRPRPLGVQTALT